MDYRGFYILNGIGVKIKKKQEYSFTMANPGFYQ